MTALGQNSARPPRRTSLGIRVLLVTVLAVLTLLAVPTPSSVGAPDARWQWPLPPPHPVVRVFEAPAHQYGPGHRGIDIASDDGAAVQAVEDGTVHFAGEVAGRPVVSVMHADGLLSTYEPVIAVVAAGDAVAAGDVIGKLGVAAHGGPHCDAGPCLHLGARRGTHYTDPLLLLGELGPSVLLPEDGASSPGMSAAPVTSASSDAPGLSAAPTDSGVPAGHAEPPPPQGGKVPRHGEKPPTSRSGQSPTSRAGQPPAHRAGPRRAERPRLIRPVGAPAPQFGAGVLR